MADGARHARGMASAPCRPRDRIPVDLHLSAHGNGRGAARTHLERAAEGDVTVHDRSGHCSFAMAIAHLERGPHFVFRVKEGANPTFDGFIAPSGTERIVTPPPPPGAPGDGTALRCRTLRVRLVRYVAGDTKFRLATSLTDGGRFGAKALSGLHHGRREPCAAFTPVTLARRLSSRCDGDPDAGCGEDGLPAMRANLRNGLRLAGRETGALFLRQARAVRQSVARIMAGLSRRLQRERPGRGHPREPERPRSRWSRRAAA